MIRSARLLEGATVKEGVRLVVRENVTLTGDLTNNGTVENNGAIAGTVEGSGSVEGSGELLAVITFEVTPEEAVVTVYDSSSDKVEAAYDKSYNLADGSYTYEVSANGYVTKSGSFEVSGAAQTIEVELDKEQGPVEPGNPEYTITCLLYTSPSPRDA